MQKIKIIFLSSSEFGETSLKRIADDKRFELLVVITLLDKPKGRGMKIESSLIKKTALELGIRVLEVSDIYDKNLEEEIKRLMPHVLVMASFGKIIPAEFLKIPSYGVLNIHPSLLPKFRGPSPIQTAILEGEKETGVTIMLTSKKMDAGQVIKSKIKSQKLKVGFKELHNELSELGAEMIIEVLPDWVSGKIKAVPQNESRATYTKKITKEDGLINWNESAEIIERKIRAFEIWPICYFFFKKNDSIIRVQVLSAEVLLQDSQKRSAGEFFELKGDLVVQTGQGILKLVKVRPEGKKEMDGKDFLQGYKKYIRPAA